MENEGDQAQTSLTTQVHEIYIRAAAEIIWDAITTSDWSSRYGHQALVHYDLRPGGQYREKANAEMRQMGLPETIIDGEVIEATPPYKLVHTMRWLFSPENAAEGFTRITWEIVPAQGGFCRLTVTHELHGAPIMAAGTSSKFNGRGGGGWTWIISDLKSLLETGSVLSG